MALPSYYSIKINRLHLLKIFFPNADLFWETFKSHAMEIEQMTSITRLKYIVNYYYLFIYLTNYESRSNR